MTTLRGSYPHPVLDASDDVDTTFEVLNVSFLPTVEDVEVSFEVRMTDTDIGRLLSDGSASYRFLWTCSATIDNDSLGRTRVTPLANTIRHQGWIDQHRIRGPVSVSVMIVAAEDLLEYRLAGQHADYQGAFFRLRPGDVIADAGYFEFEPDKMYDPLKPPLASCFDFRPDDQLRKGVQARFYDPDRVLVRFAPQLYTDFANLRDRPELQISLVVLPALMDTINFIQKNQGDGGEDLHDRRWVKAILGLVETVGNLEDSSLTLAQGILRHQLDRALAQLTEGFDD